jgi:hypothetical protein
MADTPPAEQPDEETPAEPLNRAERRAQQRGKKAKPGAPSTERPGASGPRDQVLGHQRRAGRRGNR